MASPKCRIPPYRSNEYHGGAHRNQLAREGFVFRPGAIVTISKFVESLIPDMPPVSAAALELLVEDALSQFPLTEFDRVRAYPGFRKAVMDQIQELAAAGYSSRDLPAQGEFQQILERVESEVARHGWFFPAERLERRRRTCSCHCQRGLPRILLLRDPSCTSWTRWEREARSYSRSRPGKAREIRSRRFARWAARKLTLPRQSPTPSSASL